MGWTIWSSFSQKHSVRAEVSFSGLNRAERDGDYSHSASTDVKNEYTYTPLYHTGYKIGLFMEIISVDVCFQERPRPALATFIQPKENLKRGKKK